MLENGRIVLMKEKGEYLLPNYDLVRWKFDDWISREQDYDKDVQGSEIYRLPKEKISHLMDDETQMLDVGCGSGLVGAPYAGLFPVDGVDLSVAMLEKAKAAGYRNVYAADVLDIGKIVERQYPLVVSVGLIGDYVAPEPAISAIASLVSPGGHFVYTSNKAMTDKKGQKTALRENGFGDITFERSPGYSGNNIIEELYYCVTAHKSG